MMQRSRWMPAWYVTLKDIRTYYLKPPLISWGMLFPVVLILAFFLRDPGEIRSAIPGLVGMTVLFGATSVEAVAITFEKRIGAMERLLMAPISPWALVAAKALSGALFGLGTGLLTCALGCIVWRLSFSPYVLIVLALGSIAFALLGVVLSLLMREVFDAMTLTNFFRFPMVFLSGTFVPLGDMALWLRVVACCLPLTYTVDGVRYCMLGAGHAHFALVVDLLAIALFSVALFAAALALFRHRLEDML